MIKAIALLTPVYVPLIWSLVFLIQKKTTNKAKFTLGLFMLSAFLIYSSHAIFFSNLYLVYSYLESIYFFALLLLYPLFFIYLHQLTNTKLKRGFKFYSFLPAILFSIASLVLTLCLNSDQRLLYVQDILIEKNLKGLTPGSLIGIKGIIMLLVRISFIIQTIYYLVGGIKLANKHNARITNYFSDTDGRRMNWVRHISIIILIVSIAGIVFSLIGRSYFVKHELLLLIPSLLFGSIYFEIGFKGNQQLLISEKLEDDTERFSHDIEKTEENTINSLTNQLIELFEKEKIYRQPDLRITTISSSLDTNRTYISRLINDEFNMNFNEFVNTYRIEETKTLLSNKSHNSYTMEYIAEKAGFGSVASFSRVFKEMVGTTPGKFRNEHSK